MSDGDRVVVVGAGISGLAIARDLAPDHDVVVLDKGGVAADTSSRASGMISLPLEPITEEAAAFARGEFRDLDGRGVFSFVERETVRLVPVERGEQVTEGAPNGGTFLTREGLRKRYPGVFGDLSAYEGGLVYDGTGYLDVLDYAMTLKYLAEADGARIFRDHQVTGLRVTEGDVIGVETEYGTFDADHAIYATGWRTRALLSEYVEVPIRPLRWNAIVVEPEAGLAEGCPMGSEPSLGIYWRPTSGGDLLVGGNEHLLADPEGTPMGVGESFRDTVTSRVTPLFEGVVPGRIRREDCCPTADTASPDGLPIVDSPEETPDGLVIVAGLHGRGVMCSPVVARTVRSLITGEPAPFSTEGFRLDRFDDRSATFEYRSHWD